MARRLGLPWRSGGGTLTSSQVVDYQAGYEASTRCAPRSSPVQTCVAVGGLARGRAGHLIREVRGRLRDPRPAPAPVHPIEVDESSLAFDAHSEVGHGGHFFGAQHTLERFRECFWRPTVASTERDRPLDEGRVARPRRASGAALEGAARTYERPAIDETIEEELIEFVERRAVSWATASVSAD